MPHDQINVMQVCRELSAVLWTRAVSATHNRFSQAVSNGLIFSINPTKASSEPNIMSGEKEKEQQRSLHLEWRDYIAIAIASLETTLLPIVVTALLLILMVLVLRL